MRLVAVVGSVALLLGPLAAGPGFAELMLVEDPVAFEKGKAAEVCGPAITFDEGFARSRDLNGDGLHDLVIDYADARCGGDEAYFCARTGCKGAVYFARDDGRFELSGFPTNVESMSWNDEPAVRVAYHGSFCGRANDEWCIEIWEWTADNRLKLHQDY